MSPRAFAAPPLSAYGKLPALDLVSLSPSGDKIAFVATDGETRKLFVRKVGGDALLVDPVGETKGSRRRPTPGRAAATRAQVVDASVAWVEKYNPVN